MSHHDSQGSVSLTGRRWVLHPSARLAESVPALPDWIRSILARRGLTERQAVEQYLSPSLATLPDPNSMADMSRAVSAILGSLDRRERITVFGDYDVDGVCATSILIDFLGHMGREVGYYIPDRRTEGYGLSSDAVRHLADSTDLLIAVDCGITATQEIALAQELGIRVVVVDHHKPPAELPPAVACVDPHRPDCAFPDNGLCAAGVAFMLVAALRRALRDRGAFGERTEPDVRELLDLVALATVADMVPLRGTNRILVSAGLQWMRQTRRVGLRALLDVAGVSIGDVSATDLGFKIGPRINAMGRIAQARDAVVLLTTTDEGMARDLAGRLDEANRARRDLEASTLEEALRAVEAQGLAHHPALLVADERWHPGVLGLVATRLASRFNRPCVVVGEHGKGSARSFGSLNLYAAIQATGDLLVRYGGHHAAAGLSILPENVPPFREALSRQVEAQMGSPPFVTELQLDAEVEPNRLSLAMVDELRCLEPFGQENPEPILVARDLPVQDKRVVGERHLKLRVGQPAHDAIAFNMGALASDLPSRVDIAFRLSRNEFRGRVSLQLKVEDLRTPS